MSRPSARLASALATSSSSSSSSSGLTSIRSYAAKTSSSSTGYMATAPPDNKMDHFRQILYPEDRHLLRSASPSGAHHPDHLARLQILVPSPEFHETVERAFKLFQRHKRTARSHSLRMKFKAMEHACDELDKITRPVKAGESGERYDRGIYVEAAKRPDAYAAPKPLGRRISPEQRWKEARIEGLVPREAWVPVETRGKGWNYDWQRPSDK